MASTPDTIPKEKGAAAALEGRSAVLLAVLAAAVIAAYSGIIRAPFVFDDLTAVAGNPNLSALGTAMSPPPQATTLLGRPAVSLTLAINYALSGTRVWSYHAFNIAVHILAALALFALVRRTLRTPLLAPRFGAQSGPIAIASAALWALHPLQTESVSYVVQRAESLCGLFYLLVLYGLSRAADSQRPGRWLCMSAAACLLGTTAKEVIVTAPLAALLYDRTFIAGSFRGALRQRKGYYAGLVLTWIPLGLLAAAAGWNRGGSAGFASAPAWRYWTTQFEAICRYIFLTVWPRHLVFDYGPYFSGLSVKLAACAAAVAALVWGTAAALRRRPALGFLGAWFFLVLAPSSLVPVATQTIAEHRMYLALAAPAVAAACCLFSVLGSRAWIAAAALCAALGSLTAARNEAYGSALSLWGDAARERPGNARALDNYGLALLEAGRPTEAIAPLQASVSIEPRDQGAHNNLGNALSAGGRDAEARREYSAALSIQPDFAPALFDMARLAKEEGDATAAIALLRRARTANPGNPAVELELGNLLAGRPDTLDEALSHLAAAVQLAPTASAHLGLGAALARAGKVSESEAEYRRALALDAGLASAHFGLGSLLAESGRTGDAVHEFEETLKINSSFAEADVALAVIAVKGGRPSEGLAHLEAAIHSNPGDAQAHFLRGVLLFRTGRRDEVPAEYEALLRLQSSFAEQLVKVVRGSP